jgi:hypothetical protein
MGFDLGVVAPDRVAVGLRDPRVHGAEVEEHRHARLLVRERNCLSAVVADRTSEALQPRRGQERECAAPAVAEHRYAARRLHAVDGGLHVKQHLVNFDNRAQAATGLDAVGVVAERHPALRAVEQRRRYGLEATAGVVVTYFADVCVDAEDLVQDDKAAAVGCRRRCRIGVEPMPVRSAQLDIDTLRRDPLILADHEGSPSPRYPTADTASPRSSSCLDTAFCSTLFITSL